MRTIAGFTVFVLLSASAAMADEPLYPKQDCQAVISSATAFHTCYAANLSAANKALDKIYHELMTQKVFYVGSRAKLRDVERAWIAYKEKECAFEYGSGAGNEDYWLAHADCEIRVTEARIRELQGRPSCTGGDSLCTPHMR
jgi:uncharacterized protein YecT (DUF1311 family)